MYRVQPLFKQVSYDKTSSDDFAQDHTSTVYTKNEGSMILHKAIIMFT